MRGKILKIASLLISFLLFSNLSFAVCSDDCETQSELYNYISPPPFSWFGGLSYIHHWAPPTGPWGKFFVRTHPGFSFFLGHRFGPHVGAELGWEWTANKSKSQFIPIGGSILRDHFHNLTPSSLILNSKARFKMGYLDFNIYLPFFQDCFCDPIRPELIMKIGVANAKPMLHFYVIPNTDRATPQQIAHLLRRINELRNAVARDPFKLHPINDLLFVNGKTRALLRLGIGMQWFAFTNLGVRIMYRFINTSTWRGRGVLMHPPIRKLFRDDHSLAVSLYSTFPAF